ncbi:CCA tRNA nucleotidyltransferase [Alphaproteobacteria bacterium]|nr:CCA tRNA nucleotidyltransferase [Alphaproteobacteria bacterium]
MESAGKLKPEAWMTRHETAAVMRALMADGVTARFVGGCVRDAILGRAVNDIDIATAEPPSRVVALLEAAGLKAIPTGLDYGTVTAVVDGSPFEITTLRLDVEAFGRRARVAFTVDWVADAQRRDFTMNALFCDPDGTLYDPTGGLPDLKAGRVRFVGEARERIREDVLRVLRYFRLYAYYGTGPADQDALQACQEMAPKISTLSAERIWSELKRLLGAPAPVGVLDLMADWNVLRYALPEAGTRHLLARLIAVETRASAYPDVIRRLSSLLDIDDAGVIEFAGRLRLSKVETRRLRALVNPPTCPSVNSTEAQNRAILYRSGADLFADLVLVCWAAGVPGNESAWEDLISLADRLPVSDFPIGGRDAIALGVPSGERVGDLLSIVERWWINNNFEPDRAACLERLKLVAR